jgi:hypothetical protein
VFNRWSFVERLSGISAAQVLATTLVSCDFALFTMPTLLQAQTTLLQWPTLQKQYYYQLRFVPWRVTLHGLF